MNCSVPYPSSRTARRAAVIAALLAVLIGTTVLMAGPARAAECFPAGGATMPEPPGARGDFVFSGHGWGHGVGMSQYGAKGAAELGCTLEEILTTYYPGVSVGTATTPDRLRVGIVPDRPNGPLVATQQVEVTAGTLAWTLRRTDPVTGSVETLRASQPAGSTWQVEAQSDGSIVLRDTKVDGEAGVELSGGDAYAILRATIGSATVELPSEGHTYRRGVFEFLPRQQGSSANGMYVTLVVTGSGSSSAMDAYLYGLAEMPSSWSPTALQAQAVVGRSYALAQWLAYRGFRPDCRCDLFDSTSSQNYTGYDKEGEATYGTRWVAAVDATSGRVLTSGGSVVTGFYNSSHGGHSETNAFVWGGSTLSYLAAVDDSRWDRQSGNPYGAWSMAFSTAEVSSRLAAAGFDVGTVQAITLPAPRGASGRVGDPARGAGGAVIQGTRDTVTISGNTLRTALGLRSTLVEVTSAPAACVPPADVDVDALRPVRLSGSDRVGTAVAVSAATWDTAGTAVLAAAADFPDALAGGPLAAQLDAPLLLTTAGELPGSVADELARLGVDRVFVLGGEAAVGPQVVQDLAAAGVSEVERVSGGDRWGTAAAIAAAVGALPGGEVILTLGGHEEPGRAWPDAVAAGALQAGDAHLPQLLTLPDELPEATRASLAGLRDAGATDVLVLGGAAAVGDGVVAAVEDLGLSVTRISGRDRFGTSAAVAEAAVVRGADPDAVIVATAAAFPDALSAAGLAGRTGAPLLLVDTCDLEARSASTGWLAARNGLDRVTLVGGVGALSDQVRWQLDEWMAG